MINKVTSVQCLMTAIAQNIKKISRVLHKRDLLDINIFKPYSYIRRTMLAHLIILVRKTYAKKCIGFSTA